MQKFAELQQEVHAELVEYVQYYRGEDNLSEARKMELRTIVGFLNTANNVLTLREQLAQFVITVSKSWRRVAPYTAANRLRNKIDAVISQNKFSVVELYRSMYLEAAHLNQQHRLLLNQTLEKRVVRLESEYQSVQIILKNMSDELVRAQNEKAFYLSQMKLLYDEKIQLSESLKASQQQVQKLQFEKQQQQEQVVEVSVNEVQESIVEEQQIEVVIEDISVTQNDTSIVVDNEGVQSSLFEEQGNIFINALGDSVTEQSIVSSNMVQPMMVHPVSIAVM